MAAFKLLATLLHLMMDPLYVIVNMLRKRTFLYVRSSIFFVLTLNYLIDHQFIYLFAK